jgi:DNA-binding MarR family transcriptional regulator
MKSEASSASPGQPPAARDADPFARDPDLRPGVAIKRAEQALMREKNGALRALGLTVPQYTAMLALARFPSSSGAQLARRCLVTPQSMASLLVTLERRGLVRRTTSTVHAKVFPVQLTEAGAALVAQADLVAVAVERRLADAFTESELTVLRSLLARVPAALGDGAESAESESDL